MAKQDDLDYDRGLPALKPCPFCGRAPFRMVLLKWFYVKCDNCECPCYSIVSRFSESREAAAKKWNTRKWEQVNDRRWRIRPQDYGPNSSRPDPEAMHTINPGSKVVDWRDRELNRED